MPHILTTITAFGKRCIVLWLLCAVAMVAVAQYQVVHLGQPYNTPGSETGAVQVGDTVLVYSSMQPLHGKSNSQFGFGGSQTSVYQARIARSGKLAKPRPSRWGINSKHHHTSNLALDPLTHDLYFTRCPADDPNLRCEIWWAKRHKRGWQEPQRLQGAVNLRGYTSTQPTVGRIDDSTAILYFASDRPGGMGQLDIWYCTVAGGVASQPVNLGPQVNSAYNDITPYYDQPTQVLYFSSDRPGGPGGYDIYNSPGALNTWQLAQLVCGCLNSEQNDIYFTIAQHDAETLMPVAGYLASNRTDSYFIADSMCCNDIYRWGIDSTLLQVADTVRDSVPTPAPVPDTTVYAEHRPRVSFPLFLYFHNDEPDPRSRDTLTTTAYPQLQQSYAMRRAEYVRHQPTAADSALMQEFFDSCVEGNYRRVEDLFDFIEAEVDDGQRVRIAIAGYASDLYTDQYNKALSARRIASFVNMLKQWRGGMFEAALERGSIIVEQHPHGITVPTTPSPNPDLVYGLRAAIARHIEILSCVVE